MAKKLYRNDKAGIIAGVCAGLGEYFDIDPVIIRLLCLIMFFSFGIGFLAYIVAWIIVPAKEKLEDKKEKVVNDSNSKEESNDHNTKLISGIILLLLGIFLIFNQHWYFIELKELIPIVTEFLVPALLIGIGISLLLKYKQRA